MTFQKRIQKMYMLNWVYVLDTKEIAVINYFMETIYIRNISCKDCRDF